MKRSRRAEEFLRRAKEIQTQHVTPVDPVPPVVTQDTATTTAGANVAASTSTMSSSPQHQPEAEEGGFGNAEMDDTEYTQDSDIQQIPATEGLLSVIGLTLHSRYLVNGVLGTGNFSTTYLAEDNPPEPEPPDISSRDLMPQPPSSVLVAIKRVNTAQLSPMGAAEYEILHSLFQYDSPRHIVKPLSAFFDAENIFHLVLESLDSARPVSLPDECLCTPTYTKRCASILACPGRQYLFQKLMIQLLSGIQELHKHGLIHADLTQANVLYLPESNRIKIIDLGNAIRVDDPPVEGAAEFEVQSAHYRAPEVLLGAGPVERKIDVWGAGVVGLEWLLGTMGRKELEKEFVLMGGEASRDQDEVWQPVMAVSIPSRTALVMRMAKLFGRLGCYQHGLFWREEYDSLLRAPEEAVEVDEWGLEVQQSNCGILSRFLLNTTLSSGLTEFMAKMLEVDVWQRKTCAEIMKDVWLVNGLLGEWASVLLSDTSLGGDGEEEITATGAVVVARERSVSSGEDMWVETMDDSGFAESTEDDKAADGRTTTPLIDERSQEPALGVGGQTTIPPKGLTEDKVDQMQDHCSDKPTQRVLQDELAHSPRRPLPSAPNRRSETTKRLDDIPWDDGLPFVSPTAFPFTYTRFCPSPSPALPHLFQSPSPEPLPPPSPNTSTLVRRDGDLEAFSLETETCKNLNHSEGELHDVSKQGEGQADITPTSAEDSVEDRPWPEPQPKQEAAPTVLFEARMNNHLADPAIGVWHMDLAIGTQVIYPSILLLILIQWYSHEFEY